MEENKTIAIGTFWAFAAQVGVKLFGFLYFVLITRLLGPDELGAFSTALALLGTLYIVSDFGLRGALNRYVPYFYGRGEFGRLRKTVRLAFVYGSMAALLFSAALFILAGFIADFYSTPLLRPAIEVLALWMFLQEVFDLCRGVLNGRKLMLQSQGLETAQNAFKIIITLPCLYLIGSNVVVLSGSFMMAFVVSTVIALLLTFREIANWKTEGEGKREESAPSDGKFLQELMVFGFTVVMVTFFWMVIQNTDRVMIPKLAPENGMAQGGIYMVTLGLANLLLIFTSSIAAIFFPVVSEMFGKGDRAGLAVLTSTSIRWSMLLSLPVLAMMVAYPSELLKMFYGTLYERGWFVLAIFSVGLFIRGMSMPVGMVIAAMKKPEVELKIAVFAAFLNIALNFIFIPLYGMNGAAIASAISLLAISMLLFRCGREMFGFWLPPQTANMFITGATAIAVMLLLRPLLAPLLTGAVEFVIFNAESTEHNIMTKLIKLALMAVLFALSSLVVYLLGVFVFRVIGEQEVQMIDGAMRKAGIPEGLREKMIMLLLPHTKSEK